MAETPVYLWGIGGGESGGTGTGGPTGPTPADLDELNCRADATYPWGLHGNESGGEGTGGPAGPAPSPDDQNHCRFLPCFPWRECVTVGQTAYELTRCSDGAKKYTFSDLSTYVDDVILIVEYDGCWAVAETASPGAPETITVIAQLGGCEDCLCPEDLDDITTLGMQLFDLQVGGCFSWLVDRKITSFNVSPSAYFSLPNMVTSDTWLSTLLEAGGYLTESAYATTDLSCGGGVQSTEDGDAIQASVTLHPDCSVASAVLQIFHTTEPIVWHAFHSQELNQGSYPLGSAIPIYANDVDPGEQEFGQTQQSGSLRLIGAPDAIAIITIEAQT